MSKNITRSVVLKKETWEWLDAHAKKEGRSASAVVRIIIADYRSRWGMGPAGQEPARMENHHASTPG
jgi:hypothetical protein